MALKSVFASHQALVDYDQGFLVRLPHKLGTLSPNGVLTAVATFVNLDLVAEVVVKQASTPILTDLPHENTVPVDHRRLTFGQVTIGLGQHTLVDLVGISGEVQETFREFTKVLLHLLGQLNEHLRPPILGTSGRFFDRGHLQISATNRVLEPTSLADRAVNGVRDELSEPHADLGPILRTEVKTPATVDRTAAGPAQLTFDLLDQFDAKTIVDFLFDSEELQPGQATVDPELDALAKQEIDGVLGAGTEHTNGTFHTTVTGGGHSQESVTLDRGNADIRDE